jgi:hypothetical protein
MSGDKCQVTDRGARKHCREGAELHRAYADALREFWLYADPDVPGADKAWLDAERAYKDHFEQCAGVKI